VTSGAGHGDAPWLILPTLNEALNLAALATRARQCANRLHILIVDDASTDGTAAVADELARADPHVRVLHRQGPRGYGNALTEGFRAALAAGATAVLSMDCDFSHDPADLPRLLDGLESADVVIGSRYAPGGQVAAWSRSRRLLSASANAFVHTLFRLPARDCTSGFRAYRREALSGIPWENLHSAGYSFLVEVLYWAARDGARVVHEVPIRFVDRHAGESKMGLRQIFSGATNLLRLRLRLARGRR
jgi:dolichol-phosphate mannosyltransferase